MPIKIAFGAFVLVAGLGMAACGDAAAQGFADLHAQVRRGNMICFADHFHAGNSGGHASRRDAERAAIRSWEDFTGLEYGSAWSRFKIAVGKSMQCSKLAGSWGCSVEARPCRYARGRR